MQWNEAPDIMTVVEAAKLLKVGKNRMYELCKIPGFPKIVLGNGRIIRIPKDALRLWIENTLSKQKTA